MYHKCVKCGKLYERDSEDIITGCSCGSKLFYFIRPQSTSKKADQEEIEYFYEIEEDDNKDSIVFDIEAIKVIGNGKYALNIDKLMNDDGMIYEYGEGKYSIDVNVSMKHAFDNKSTKKKR